MIEGWKRWRGKMLIPVMHEPGLQRGFKQSGKHTKVNKSEHASRPHKSVRYWPLIPWGQEPR